MLKRLLLWLLGVKPTPEPEPSFELRDDPYLDRLLALAQRDAEDDDENFYLEGLS